MKIFLIDLFFICVVAFVLKVSIAQAYNIIFMYLKRPYLWLLIVILLAIINMIISTFFNQGINIFSYAVILTVFNLNSEKFKSKELQKVVRDTTDEIYLALGIRYRLFYYLSDLLCFDKIIQSMSNLIDLKSFTLLLFTFHFVFRIGSRLLNNRFC
jgi:hypothetical protein